MGKKIKNVAHEIIWEAPFNETYRISIRQTHDEEGRIFIGLIDHNGNATNISFQCSPSMIPRIVKALQRAYQDFSLEEANKDKH